MSEAIEYAQIMKEERKRNRRKAKHVNTKRLLDEGIEFESFNHGLHLRIKGKNGEIDFWPSTGKWFPRYPGGKRGWGVDKLIYIAKNGEI